MFFQINMLQISATRSNQNNDLNQAKENFTQKQLFNPDNALDSLLQIMITSNPFQRLKTIVHFAYITF